MTLHVIKKMPSLKSPSEIVADPSETSSLILVSSRTARFGIKDTDPSPDGRRHGG